MKRDDTYYLVKDLVQGESKIALLDEFNNLGADDIIEALRKITTDPQLSSKKKYQIINESWRINYRVKPPTIEEFLTPAWIGPTADSLYPHVRKILTEFWQPDSKKRNLILGSSIGTGKALPDSSPVVVDEVPSIKIELENGEKLFFDEEDFVWFYDTNLNLSFVKAKDLELVEVKDFPVPLNYYIMRVYNIDKIDELKKAKDIDSYDNLIEYFKSFSKDFFDERDIYVERHHIVPRSEKGSDEKINLVYLPFYFHVKAHYLRAREHEKKGNRRKALSNYKAVIFSLGLQRDILEDELEVFKKIQFVSETLEKRNSLQSEMFFIKKEGKPSKKIFEEEWLFYKNKGWEKGRNFKNPSNKKWVNKDGLNYYVNKEEFEEYLSNGYSSGMFLTEKMIKANKTKLVHSTLNTTWMNKNGKRKCVKNSEVDIYLEKGWLMGSNSKTCKGKKWKWKEEDVGRKIYTNGEIEVLSKECPEGFWKGRKTKGKHWFNDGNKNILADKCPLGFISGKLKTEKHFYTNGEKTVLSKECPEGFWKGKHTKGKKGWYTNGYNNVCINLDDNCPDGYWRGKTLNNENKKCRFDNPDLNKQILKRFQNKFMSLLNYYLIKPKKLIKKLLRM